MVTVLLATCFVYYRVCDAVGFPLAWSFLMGLLPAWPFAVWAERGTGRMAWLVRVVCFILGFSICYWTGAGFIAWKETLAD